MDLGDVTRDISDVLFIIICFDYQNMVGDWLADAVITDAEFGMSSDEMYDSDSTEGDI